VMIQRSKRTRPFFTHIDKLKTRLCRMSCLLRDCKMTLLTLLRLLSCAESSES